SSAARQSTDNSRSCSFFITGLNLQVQFQLHRAVIGTEYIGVNARLAHPVLYIVGYQKIINSPTGVVLPRLKTVAPPAVHPGGIGVQVTEGVGESGVQQPGEALPLLIRKTGVSPIRAGILQINLLKIA